MGGWWEGRKGQRISNVPVLCKEHANNPSTLHYHSALRVFQQVQEGGALQRRPSGMKKTPQPPTLARTPLGWGEGQTGPTNGLMIHRWALVCANWLCWPPDSWQGAGLWGTPVSLPPPPTQDGCVRLLDPGSVPRDCCPASITADRVGRGSGVGGGPGYAALKLPPHTQSPRVIMGQLGSGLVPRGDIQA